MRLLSLVVLFALLSACSPQQPTSDPEPDAAPPLESPRTLSPEEAAQLATLPLACVHQEYPNKLGQVLGGDEDLGSPQQLHPAFYGCFDWHSSVHGHWSLVRLLKRYPDMPDAAQARAALNQSLTPENIAGELVYFHGKHNTSYERTYGWAWLLKLAEELHTWDDPDARRWEATLQPLTDMIAVRFVDFLPKLVYAIRVGEHTNTAFGMSFAHDYAMAVRDSTLQTALEQASLRFFQDDAEAPLAWEPSGYDFLSPTLEEVDMMRRVLDEEAFMDWLNQFMPWLAYPSFTLEPGRVSDRTDGKLVHLDGLNFSRAWVLYGLAEQYPDRFAHLHAVANAHVAHSLNHLVGDSYEGGHWLGSFALYALTR